MKVKKRKMPEARAAPPTPIRDVLRSSWMLKRQEPPGTPSDTLL
jgi:hypothetical protein